MGWCIFIRVMLFTEMVSGPYAFDFHWLNLTAVKSVSKFNLASDQGLLNMFVKANILISEHVRTRRNPTTMC